MWLGWNEDIQGSTNTRVMKANFGKICRHILIVIGPYRPRTFDSVITCANASRNLPSRLRCVGERYTAVEQVIS